MSSSFLDVVGIGLVGAFLLLIVNFNQMLHKLPMSLQNFLSGFTENKVIFFIGIGLIFAFILIMGVIKVITSKADEIRGIEVCR